MGSSLTTALKKENYCHHPPLHMRNWGCKRQMTRPGGCHVRCLTNRAVGSCRLRHQSKRGEAAPGSDRSLGVAHLLE